MALDVIGPAVGFGVDAVFESRSLVRGGNAAEEGAGGFLSSNEDRSEPGLDKPLLVFMSAYNYVGVMRKLTCLERLV